MRIARIFPRKTEATPDDSLVFFSDPPEGLDIDEAHISVTFSYDKEKAEKLFGNYPLTTSKGKVR